MTSTTWWFHLISKLSKKVSKKSNAKVTYLAMKSPYIPGDSMPVLSPSCFFFSNKVQSSAFTQHSPKGRWLKMALSGVGLRFQQQWWANRAINAIDTQLFTQISHNFMAAVMVHKRDETVQQRILPITYYEGEEYHLRSFLLVTLFHSPHELW